MHTWKVDPPSCVCRYVYCISPPELCPPCKNFHSLYSFHISQKCLEEFEPHLTMLFFLSMWSSLQDLTQQRIGKTNFECPTYGTFASGHSEPYTLLSHIPHLFFFLLKGTARLRYHSWVPTLLSSSSFLIKSCRDLHRCVYQGPLLEKRKASKDAREISRVREGL